jgi:hypothetical protein
MTKSNYVAATRMLGAGGQYSLFWPKKYTVCVVAILTHLEPSDLPETWHEYYVGPGLTLKGLAV